ncbi:MAG: prepilin peptidase [Bryobacteraceae bacterium]
MTELILAGLFGLLIGSFLNVCIYRLPRDLSVVAPRSFCPGCEKTIAWYDNIPVLSYLLLRGRCRNCSIAIPWRYPLVELLTGTLFVTAILTFGAGLSAIKFCIFAAIQVALIFSDVEQRILPDEFTLGGAVTGLVLAGFVPIQPGLLALLLPSELHWRWLSVAESACSAAFVSLVLWGVGELYYRIRKREGLGFGDVKMVACIGAFLGLGGALYTVMLGSILGSMVGLAFIYLTKKDASSYQLPFGSFLAVAAILVALESALFVL